MQPHYYLDRYDLAGNRLFDKPGPVESANQGVDLCQDGSTVAVLGSNGSKALYDFDPSGAIQWMAPVNV